MKIFSHGPEPGGCGLTLLGDDGLLAVRALERLLLGEVVLKHQIYVTLFSVKPLGTNKVYYTSLIIEIKEL